MKQECSIDNKTSEIIKVSKYFHSKGWMQGTSGNLSIKKDGSSFYITSSGKDKGELIEDDILLVNMNGELILKSSSEPSAETLLHSAIYKHTNAEAIFHVHTTNSTLLSMMHLKSKINSTPSPLTFSGLEMLKGLGLKTHDCTIHIPCIENSQDMKYIADIAPNNIAENIPGLLLAGHGIYAWGNSISDAKRHAEIFEFLFEYRIMELSVYG